MRQRSAVIFWTALWIYFLGLCSGLQDAAPPAGTSSDAKEDETLKSTTFNGKEVPPMTDLHGEHYKDQISKGYWLVDAFSPYCGHCLSLAPKLQTLYEFYYTSDPIPASTNSRIESDSLNSFTRYYDFKFAKLNCIAFGTACNEIGATSYPTLILFKDGEQKKVHHGDLSIEDLSQFIEECLEIIRPGSRQQGGIEIPEAGAKEFTPKKPAGSPQTKSSPESTDNAPKKALSEPSQTTNPEGISYDFTYDTFQSMQRKTLDPWFVKFYAPWCPHCQRLAPSWKAMAEEMKGKLNVGEVNCDVQGKLCAEMDVKNYPTIYLLRGTERIDYQGLRGLGDLVKFANRAAGVSSVQHVTAADFEELEKTEEVIFVYLYDHATTTEDLMALERLPMTLMDKGRMVKTDDKDLAKRFNVLSFPGLLVSRDGKATVYEGHAPHEMRNITRIRDWMKTVWLPLVPELSVTNAHELIDGKLAVLAILSHDRKEQFALAKHELKSAALEWIDREETAFAQEREGLRGAKQLRIEEAEEKGDKSALEKAKLLKVDTKKSKRKEVVFTWVDGVFWERWIRTSFGISIKDDGEKVIIHDQANRRYWDTTWTGDPILPSRTSILDTLTYVRKDPRNIPYKPTDNLILRIFRNTTGFIFGHPWLTIFFGIVSSIITMTMWTKIRRRSRSFGSSGGFFKLEEKIGTGRMGNGKVD